MRERIAVVTTSYPEGPGDPSGHFVESEVRALEAAGADVEVFALRGAAFGWPGLAARLRAKPWLALGALRTMARTRGAVTHLGSFSRVIAHWALPSAWPVSWTAKSLEVVSHGGDVRVLVQLPAPIRERLVATILQNTHIWRFASDGLAADLTAALSGATRRRLEAVARVVPPPLELDVDPKAVERAKARQRALAKGAPAFVAAARLVPSKRVDLALAIAAREKAALFVIGDGPERENLERMARERRAQAHFFGMLARPETLAHIAAADALLHTSEAEGLSSVVREAEALGTPVLSR